MSDMCTDNHMSSCSSACDFFKECSYYEQCDKNEDDICSHPRCQYSVHVLSYNSYFKCGRKAIKRSFYGRKITD